jgi:hypothetical protein
VIRAGRISWILWRGKGCVSILMESKWKNEDDLDITVTVERIGTSVTSPDFGDSDNILLGVVQAASSKGSHQADVILNLREYYEIVDQVFAVCCDTTSSNTGVFSGAMWCFRNLEHSTLGSLKEEHAGSAYLSLHGGLDWREDKGPKEGAVCQTSEGLANSQVRLTKWKS